MTTIRKNITQPADWWAAFADAAKANGKTLSEWVGDCCLGRLRNSTAKELSERPSTGRPKNPEGVSGLPESE